MEMYDDVSPDFWGTAMTNTTQLISTSRRPRAPRVHRNLLPERVRGILAVLIPTVVTAVHAAAYGRWIVDDAGITFAYARSITSGAGPALQPGGPAVEGYSDPAWLAVLAVGRTLGLFDRGAWAGVPDYVLFPKGVALLCCAGVFLAGYRVASAVCRRPALVAVAAGIGLAVMPSFVIWSFSGLENSLLALAVSWLAAVLVRAVAVDRLLTMRTGVTCGLLAALAALTRPEGIVYAATCPVVIALFAGRRTLARSAATAGISVAAFAVPAGGYLLWRLATFHELLPNTALAKAQRTPEFTVAHRAIDIIGYAGWPVVLIAAACVGAVIARPSSTRRAVVVLAVPMGLSVFAYTVLARDWMGELRFATPVWPLAALATAIAVEAVAHGTAARGRAVLAVCTAAACVLTGTMWLQRIERFSHGPTVSLCAVADQARRYDEYARIAGVRDATILLPDIGGTALAGRLRVADLAGLADRDIARFWSARDMTGLRDHVFTRLRPTFIHVHGGWTTRTGLLTDPRASLDYTVLRQHSATSADLVRTNVIDGPVALARLRAAAQRADAQRAELAAAPRRSCGPTLRPTE